MGKYKEMLPCDPLVVHYEYYYHYYKDLKLNYVDLLKYINIVKPIN